MYTHYVLISMQLLRRLWFEKMSQFLRTVPIRQNYPDSQELSRIERNEVSTAIWKMFRVLNVKFRGHVVDYRVTTRLRTLSVSTVVPNDVSTAIRKTFDVSVHQYTRLLSVVTELALGDTYYCMSTIMPGMMSRATRKLLPGSERPKTYARFQRPSTSRRMSKNCAANV